MTKIISLFSGIPSRKPKKGDVTIYQRPHTLCKTVKIDEATYQKLGQMANEKGTSRHAEMREAIKRHVACFFRSS